MAGKASSNARAAARGFTLPQDKAECMKEGSSFGNDSAGSYSLPDPTLKGSGSAARREDALAIKKEQTGRGNPSSVGLPLPVLRICT